MIKIRTLPNKEIDCIFEGNNSDLFVEYNSATIGFIKKLRNGGKKDKDIRDLLLGNVDIAFKVLESDEHIKEIHDGK